MLLSLNSEALYHFSCSNRSMMEDSYE
jgi:hypothetical protein